MVIFRVTQNINIKTTDATLVKYEKLRNPSNLINETLYITTLEDFFDLRQVLLNVANSYKIKTIDESKIRYLNQFPIELGVENINEYSLTNKLEYKYKNKMSFNYDKSEYESLYLNEDEVNFKNQISKTLKKDIKLVVLGTLGNSISEMICACTALRILHEKLSKQFRTVVLDIYINASENRFYTRDKMIFSNQSFVNKVTALSISVKEFCQYDFFIDGSSVFKRSFYKNLNYTDAWLYKFGIDYKKIPEQEKYNSINLHNYKPKTEMEEKIKQIKKYEKTIFFHPFSADANKSIPKEYALKLLEKLLELMPDYAIISSLKIDQKFTHNRYFDLSNESRTFLDFCYIVSNAQKVLTVNTSTYHIADAFFIPTVVIYTFHEKRKKQKQYCLSKAVYVDDKSKDFSQFVFENNKLLLYRFEGWQKLKASKVIKLLDKL